MNILKKIEKTTDCWFLISISFLFFILRLPSFFEPYWYGDEGIYQTLGLGINNGLLLYRDIWDNKTPLLYALYAFFGSDQFTIRFVSFLFGLSAVIAFYFLAKKLFADKRAVFVTTSLFAIFFGLPLLEGNIANSENFMLFPILLSGLLVYKAIEHSHLPSLNYQLFIAGGLLGLAFLFKIVAVFDFAAIFLFIVFSFFDKKQKKEYLEKIIIFSLAFLTPLILSLIFFTLNGALSDYINAAFKQNVGYVGYGNQFLIPQGLLILKLLILGVITFFLFVKRQIIGTNRIFIFLWFIFSIFNAFFSQRPYTHYMLVLLPSFMLLLGLLYDPKYKKIISVISVITFFVVLTSFNFYGKTFKYYQNFISFLISSKTVSQYQSFFDGSTPRDYALAAYINSHAKKDDNIFIWGNNAQVYALTNKLPSGRYTVAYHMQSTKESLKETQDAIQIAKPKYFIVASEKFPPTFPLPAFKQKIIIFDSVIYETVY